jgi:hypothetical protein
MNAGDRNLWNLWILNIQYSKKPHQDITPRRLIAIVFRAPKERMLENDDYPR